MATRAGWGRGGPELGAVRAASPSSGKGAPNLRAGGSCGDSEPGPCPPGRLRSGKQASSWARVALAGTAGGVQDLPSWAGGECAAEPGLPALAHLPELQKSSRRGGAWSRRGRVGIPRVVVWVGRPPVTAEEGGGAVRRPGVRLERAGKISLAS